MLIWLFYTKITEKSTVREHFFKPQAVFCSVFIKKSRFNSIFLLFYNMTHKRRRKGFQQSANSFFNVSHSLKALIYRGFARFPHSYQHFYAEKSVEFVKKQAIQTVQKYH